MNDGNNAEEDREGVMLRQVGEGSLAVSPRGRGRTEHDRLCRVTVAVAVPRPMRGDDAHSISNPELRQPPSVFVAWRLISFITQTLELTNTSYRITKAKDSRGKPTVVIWW